MAEEIITFGDNITTPLSVDNGPSIVTIGSGDTNITIGDGQDTITAKNNDTIKVGNGPDIITIGDGNTLTVGSGPDTITAGNNNKIVDGNGIDTITAGTNSNITAGNGPDHLTAGPNSTIVAGNGNDTVRAGHDSTITLGSGTDTVHAGTTDTITFLKAGFDTTDYDGLTPAFTVPASITMNEEQTLALPITILPPSLGNEVINGFKTANGIIAFDINDFPNAAQVLAHAAQSGPNVVITQPGGGGTVTITNTSLSSLSAANFAFFTGATDVVNITGLPSDANLSAGTNNGGGSWTLTPAQLSGLTLTAGEPSGDLGTPDTVTVTITNPSGQGATLSHAFPLVVNAIPPTVSDSVIAYQSGDPITETRLQLNSAVDSGDSGNDFINRIVLTGVPTDGTTITSPDATVTNNGGGMYTLSTTGHPASFNPEVDVTTPGATSENFNIGIQAFSDEPNSPELSASTSQNIDVQYEPQSFNPTFAVNNANMWNSGPAFSLHMNTFLGIDLPSGFPGSPPFSTSATFLGASFGATLGLKAGFQSDLNLNGGSYNASLPYNINLANTFNKTNDTLEVDPNESQGTATLNTFSPQGSYSLSVVLDALLKAFAGPFSITLNPTASKTLISFNSTKLHTSFTLPDGIGTVTANWPTLNLSGSSGGSTVSASGVSNPIVGVNIDPIAVALDIVLGDDPLKGSGSINVLLGSLSWHYTLAAGTLEPTINLGQAFNLNIGALSPTLTDNGSPVAFNFSSPTIIQNAPGSNSFDLGLTPSASLSNDTSLAAQLILGIRLLEASGTVTALGFNVTSGTIGPVFHTSTTLNLGNIPIFQNTFPVALGSKSENFSVT